MEAAPRPDHYFSTSPSGPSRRRHVDLVLPDIHARLVTSDGVFSADQLDPGTRFLLLEAPPPDPDVRIAVDLGCGYGPIARVLVERASLARVLAVDVNERALALAAENLAGFPRATVARPEATAADLMVDLIWSNPPIHVGKAALHSLLRMWLDRLAPTGVAVLVVHRHLGADSLARWLTETGWPTRRLASRQGYRLLEVNPRPEIPAAGVASATPDQGFQAQSEIPAPGVASATPDQGFQA